MLDPSLAGPLSLVTEVSLLQVYITFIPFFRWGLWQDIATWHRQDVLAGIRSTLRSNDKYRVFVSPTDKMGEDHRRYSISQSLLDTAFHCER